jgi:predicted  nucleic acid-binding Zn-ribbon protein
MSGNNGIIYTLVFFVLLSVILLIVTVLSYSQSGEDAVNIDKLTGDLATANTGLKTQTNAVTRLKQVIGYEFDDLGAADETVQDSVIGALLVDLKSLGGDAVQGESTVKSALQGMRTSLNDERLGTASHQAALKNLNNNYLVLNAQKQAIIDQHLAQVKKVELDLQKKDKTHTEELDRKNQQITELSAETKDLQDTLAQKEQEAKDAIEELQEDLNKQIIANGRLREQVNGLEDLSFERADGIVRWVDHNRNLVWLNLGESDGLRIRTTFSVYTKANHGVARRDKEDIKAKIEVTSLKGAHLCEARILEQDIYRPIAKGDPVYSPAFTVGNTEYFSIIGLVDLDGDGISDREYLENMVKAAGAEFDNIIGDDGILQGNGVSAKTTFLIQGEIPGEVTTGDAQLDEAYKRMREIHGKMTLDARAQGVRIISLGDFKDYLGIAPPPRSWRPGDVAPYTLKAGARSAGVNQTIGGRAESGSVSGTYKRNKRLGQQSSSGQTSKLFGK